MEASKLQIHALVEEIKEGVFRNVDPYTLVSLSAYDTAWLAMIPDSNEPFRPMFKDCLNWVLDNQRQEGWWGVCDSHGNPTIESLSATLVCIIVLKQWNVGKANIDKGLGFVYANLEELLKENYGGCPRWFAMVFPAMVELASTVGLEIVFPDRMKGAVSDIFSRRRQILETEELVDKPYNLPLLAYLEVLPSSYAINEEQLVKHLSDDGSLFQSPSATAGAFMATGNKSCLAYLQSLVQRNSNGVPPVYPIDEDLIKLSVVNQIQRLGLVEHFVREIEEILKQVYRNYNNEGSSTKQMNLFSEKLYKDSLAFQLLRRHGYRVSPGIFCWFLQNREIQDHVDKDQEYFSSLMLNVHRATDIMFPEEYELEEARSFARKSLEKNLSAGNRDQHDFAPSSSHRVIQHELDHPWLTRLEHLEHRMCIEESDMNALWKGKTSFHRLSSSHNEKLIQLAKMNFELRQSVYKNELEELKRWSKEWGLTDMGFGREKTTYCYFAVASSTTLPYDSLVRLIVAKGAIIITVADDFFDMKGSLDELINLTDAVRRWDSKGLNGHSKTIFEALDHHVKEIAEEHLQQQGSDITKELQDLWCETFESWLTEATWSRSGWIPSMDEYLETGMISIATHTLTLIASCLMSPSLPSYKLRPPQYETLTKLLMIIPRLLNDIQSYEKEQEEGKTNLVLLYAKGSPEVDIEASIAYVRDIIAKMEKQIFQLALIDGYSDLPESVKSLHLSCLKVFTMFFHSSNRYNSDTALFHDIQKAIYVPIQSETLKPRKHVLPLPHGSTSKEYKTTLNSYRFDRSSVKSRGSLAAHEVPRLTSRNGYKNMVVPALKFRLSFI
ncbi:(E,E)-geranyllinalool synthase isoform X2 [Mangifera indica]|uniref:(E,E)-geranyllinalool synthase isoform X2 n=1 Tax=Mangifera indica TaxID=29780 RepID=UPI001CF9AD7C|nr:(E,E)-geranyllinalool synthase isoform X2 [Mangifera indica]